MIHTIAYFAMIAVVAQVATFLILAPPLMIALKFNLWLPAFVVDLNVYELHKWLSVALTILGWIVYTIYMTQP